MLQLFDGRDGFYPLAQIALGNEMLELLRTLVQRVCTIVLMNPLTYRCDM